jgi:hypothetical protein
MRKKDRGLIGGAALHQQYAMAIKATLKKYGIGFCKPETAA